MSKFKNKILMRKELLDYLEKIEKLKFNKTFPKNSFTTPKTRLGVIIATSILKIQSQTEELLASILDKKFFSSLSIMRMIFEEVILITFVASKMKKAKSLDSANHVLYRVSVGTSSYKYDEDSPSPYNINTTLEEAEQFIGKQSKDLKGIFDNTYSFISDYVHPNAPSRFHFMKQYGNAKRIMLSPTSENDIKMLLNFACMTIGLYLYSIQILLEFDLSKLPE